MPSIPMPGSPTTSRVRVLVADVDSMACCTLRRTRSTTPPWQAASAIRHLKMRLAIMF